MAKPPEEGLIWEWRAFGRISDALSAKVRKHPIRQGIRDVRGEDLYLISPESEQNVKLRRSEDGWLLKLKLLIETRGEYELYNEGADLIYEFPVSVDQLKAAALLLGVTLPALADSIETVTEAAFLKALGEATPAVAQSKVTKTRSQYRFENGWLELADVKFARRETQSLSVHSREIEVVKEMIERLRPGDKLEPMNYVEACMRWG